MNFFIPILISIGIFEKSPSQPSYADEELIGLGASYETQIGVSAPVITDSGSTDADLQRAHWSHVTTTLTSPPYFSHLITFPSATVAKYWEAEADFTGDGIRDLVYRSPGDGQLKLARNLSSYGNPEYAAPVNLFSEGNFPLSEVSDGKLPLKLRFTSGVVGSDGVATSSVEYVRLQDLDGDGRVDIVDARNPGEWIAYLNTPSGSSALVYWMKTQVPVGQLVDNWRDRVSVDDSGTGFTNGWISGVRLPLSWTLSGVEKAHARAYEYWGWNFQNGCMHVSPMTPLETPLNSCAWERESEWDINWTMAGTSRSYLIFNTQGIVGSNVPDLVGIDWSQGFHFVRDWEPKDLQKTVANPECRPREPWSQDCEPGIFVASAELPWVEYASPGGAQEVVLPKPEGTDLTLDEQIIRNSYDAFMDCYSEGEVVCSPTELIPVQPGLLPAFADCYSWYGGRRGDLKPSDGYECYVEDFSKRWRGFSRHVNDPRD